MQDACFICVCKLFFPIAVFSKAVSESLNSLMNAAAQDCSADRTANPSTASVHCPASSEAEESKAVADDVMVQITARKSEVGPRRRLRQLFLQSETFPSSPLLLAVKQMNNQK